MTNVSREDWNKRVHGYDRSLPFIPPITNPVTVMDFLDKYVLTLSTDAGYVRNEYDTAQFVNWLSGEPSFGFSYLNAQAAGAQLYPFAAHKYYDLFSDSGLTEFGWTRFLYTIEWWMTIFTILPWDMWLALFTMEWGDIWVIPLMPWFYQANVSFWWMISTSIGNIIYWFFSLFLWIYGPWVIRFLDIEVSGGWNFL